jgi:DNA-binding GntR family transcriptional regulator
LPETARIPTPLRLRDQVYERLRADLEDGQLPPDHRFVEVELAARYGVSRTPVREALLQLSREGVLVPLERGYALKKADLKQILDRLEVRRMLDVQVARRAAMEATPHHLRKAQAAFDGARSAHRAGRHRAFAFAQGEFRSAIQDACANEALRRCSALVDDSFRFLRLRLFEAPTNRERTLAATEEIIEAIRAQCPDSAEKATLRFLDALEEFHKAAAG